MIMKKLHYAFDLNGGGYSSPELLVLDAVTETGFANSKNFYKNWNNGSISEEDVNEWEEIL